MLTSLKFYLLIINLSVYFVAFESLERICISQDCDRIALKQSK